MSGVTALRELLGADRITPVPVASRRTVAVPLADHEEILGCIGRAIGKIAEFLLIGDESRIRAASHRAGSELTGASFLSETEELAACALAARLVRGGRAQLLMKGQVHTATFTRAILDKSAGLVEPGRLVSHVTVCGVPSYDRLFLLTDAGISIEPTVEQKIQIVRNAAEVARLLGIVRPKVACVAPVEKVSPKVRSTVDAQALQEIGRDPSGPLKDVDVQGPLGLDLAVSPEAARTKGVTGPVAGRADILLLPGLDSANVLYKSLTCFAGATMASVLAGARVPVVLTSRADDEETRYLSLLLGLRLAR